MKWIALSLGLAGLFLHQAAFGITRVRKTERGEWKIKRIIEANLKFHRKLVPDGTISLKNAIWNKHKITVFWDTTEGGKREVRIEASYKPGTRTNDEETWKRAPYYYLSSLKISNEDPTQTSDLTFQTLPIRYYRKPPPEYFRQPVQPPDEFFVYKPKEGKKGTKNYERELVLKRERRVAESKKRRSQMESLLNHTENQEKAMKVFHLDHGEKNWPRKLRVYEKWEQPTTLFDQIGRVVELILKRGAESHKAIAVFRGKTLSSLKVSQENLEELRRSEQNPHYISFDIPPPEQQGAEETSFQRRQLIQVHR